METSGWDIALSISTVGLALATIVLAAAAVYAARVAVHEVRQTRVLADVDTRRRRAEASQEALRRFMTVYDREHETMLAAARAVTKQREEAAGDGHGGIQRCRIPDLLSEEHILGRQTPEVVLNALQACLDALEEIGVGVELGVYDRYVLYHGAFNRIHQLIEWSRPFIKMSHEGRIPHRPAQHTAFQQVERLDEHLLAIQKAGSPARLAGALEDGMDDRAANDTPNRKRYRRQPRDQAAPPHSPRG
jgi:hypothetical protein